MAYPAAKQIQTSVSIKYDAATVGSFSLPSAAEATSKTVKTVELAAAAADVEIDLAEMAETVELFWVKPLSGQAISVGVGVTAPAAAEKIVVGATGMLLAAPGGAAAQKLFVTNSDGADSALIEVGVLGDFTQ